MWVDRWVLDSHGVRLGVAVAVVAEHDTGQPVWLAVYTGVPDATVVIVPVHGSSLLGDDIVIDAERDSVLAAAPIELTVHLDPAEDRFLDEHFRRHACVAAHPSPRNDP